jgi:hypothetical protein
MIKRVPMIDGLRIDEAHKGGKGGAPAPMPLVAPAAPIEEASVEIEDRDKKAALKSSKSSLKLPLANTDTTGLKV